MNDYKKILRAVHLNCIDCFGGSIKEAEKCDNTKCKLFKFKLKKNDTKTKSSPSAKRNGMGAGTVVPRRVHTKIRRSSTSVKKGRLSDRKKKPIKKNARSKNPRRVALNN